MLLPVRPAAPSVSVAVIAYNQERFLPACLNSLTAQAGPAWEAVVADDCSTDGTAALLAGLTDPRIRAVRTPANLGISYARNAALFGTDPRTASLLFLDGDDALLPGALAALARSLDGCPEAVMVVGRAAWMDADGNRTPPAWGLAAREGLQDYRQVLAHDAWTGIYPPSVAMFRRWAVDAAGGFWSPLRFAEDTDFYRRVLLHGPALFVPDEVTLYRRHGGNATTPGRTLAGRTQAEWDAASARRHKSYDAAWGRICSRKDKT